MKSINILLLSAGTNAIYHLTKVLKEKYKCDFFLIGADINKSHLISSSPYLDKYYQVPFSKDPAYYEEIIKICDLNNVDYIIPSFDIDQKLFYPENPELLNRNIKSLSTSESALKFYENKELMQKLLLSKHIPTPKSYSADQLINNKKYFIKPINGTGSIGAREDYGINLKKIENIKEFIIQEICFGPEFTLECFHLNNHFSSVTRERIETKAGVCTKARVFHDSILEQIALLFTKTINPPLYFNLQFMRNSQGVPVITDVNLRLAGGMSLSCAAGWDEVSAIASYMKNEKAENIFKNFKLNAPIQYVVRAYTDTVTAKKKGVMAIDLDGTLLNSVKRHEIVMKDALKYNEIDIDTDGLNEYKSNGKTNLEFLLEKGISSEKAKNIQNKWIQMIESESYLCTDFIYDDAIPFLEKAIKVYDIILVTARKNFETASNQIKKSKLEKYFTKVFVVKTGSEKAKILKEEQAVIMIGDTEVDLNAALEAGIEYRLLSRGFRNKNYWKKNNQTSFENLLHLDVLNG